LAYDALDPGIYATDIAEDIFLLPYPSSNAAAFLSRLEYVHDRVGLDVIIPTLDSELPAFLALSSQLRSLGISTFLPTVEQLDLRAKNNLQTLGACADIDVPKTMVLTDIGQLSHAHDLIPYPFFVKGPYYGAKLVHTHEAAVSEFREVAARWGLPIIVQAYVSGQELNVVGVGDGEGGLWGAVAMKKLMLTDKGKGWAGVTIRDLDLMSVTERFAKATRWRGPFEVEVMREPSGRYQLLEINPRFPAWVHLATAAGINLPAAVVEFAMGRRPAAPRTYDVGTLFVRISLDQIATIQDLDRIVTAGEIRRSCRNPRAQTIGDIAATGPREATRSSTWRVA
jgi:carbamoyl-phosphate synthase large subunit